VKFGSTIPATSVVVDSIALLVDVAVDEETALVSAAAAAAVT
jgi:hypothetical protein